MCSAREGLTVATPATTAQGLRAFLMRQEQQVLEHLLRYRRFDFTEDVAP